MQSIRLLYATLLIVMMSFFIGCRKNDAKLPPTIPVVTTAALTNITSSGATSGGTIVSNGGEPITASGIVWSKTNAQPTLADSSITTVLANEAFTIDLSNLEFNTAYHIRAFATNSVGTGYGEVVTLNTSNDTNKVRFTYNGEEVTYGIIVSPTTGKKWLDRNLGAKRAALAVDDYEAYGDFFQWGRPADGHQLINWTSSTSGTPVNGMIAELATSDTPGHNKYIILPVSDGIGDWRNENNRNRWATDPQGPCPEGWHVPSTLDWQPEVAPITDGFPSGGTAKSGGIKNGSSAFALMKLPAAGGRDPGTASETNPASLYHVGIAGIYWCSSDVEQPISSTNHSLYSRGNVFKFRIGATARDVDNEAKAGALPIRCVKD